MTLAPERDLGTPAVRSGSDESGVSAVTVTVDGIPVSVPEGTSVLRAAAATYVAATVTAILQLLYYLSLANRRR